MQTRPWASGVLVMAAFLCGEAFAQDGIRWEETSLEAAQRRASQTRRLVVVHFWSPNCAPCQKMDRNVFSRPDVAEAIEANFVPVKVNADQFPHTCRQYGITALPTDLVLTPSGHLVRRFQGAVPAENYVAQLNQVAAEVNLGPPPALARAEPPPAAPTAWNTPPTGPRPPESGFAEPGWGAYRGAGEPGAQRDRPPSLAGRVSPEPPPASGTGGPGAVAPSRDALARSPSWRSEPIGPPMVGPPMTGPPAPAAPPAPPAQPGPPPAGATAGLAPGNPPLGLEGYCPVELVEKRRWHLGTHPWGVIHRGRTYMCAGPEEQKKFLANPDFYAPVISGDDVVLSLDRGQSVPGRREHGVFYRGRIYLFAEETSLNAFRQDPGRYAEILQTMRPGDRTPQR